MLKVCVEPWILPKYTKLWTSLSSTSFSFIFSSSLLCWSWSRLSLQGRWPVLACICCSFWDIIILSICIVQVIELSCKYPLYTCFTLTLCLSHNPLDNHYEDHWWQQAALTDPCVHLKWLWQFPILNDLTGWGIIKRGLNQLNKLKWTLQWPISCQMTFLTTLSKAFWKAIKFT